VSVRSVVSRPKFHNWCRLSSHDRSQKQNRVASSALRSRESENECSCRVAEWLNRRGLLVGQLRKWADALLLFCLRIALPSNRTKSTHQPQRHNCKQPRGHISPTKKQANIHQIPAIIMRKSIDDAILCPKYSNYLYTRKEKKKQSNRCRSHNPTPIPCHQLVPPSS
jgi:hypothetical protein